MYQLTSYLYVAHIQSRWGKSKIGDFPSISRYFFKFLVTEADKTQSDVQNDIQSNMPVTLYIPVWQHKTH